MGKQAKATKQPKQTQVVIFPKGTTTVAFLDWKAAAAKFIADPSEANAALCRVMRKRYYLLSRGEVPPIDEAAVDAVMGL